MISAEKKAFSLCKCGPKKVYKGFIAV